MESKVVKILSNRRLVYYQVNLEKGTHKCTLPVAHEKSFYNPLKHHLDISGHRGTGLVYSKEKGKQWKTIKHF